MKKLLISLIVLALSGCAVYPVEYTGPVVVEPAVPCCVYYGGVYGFWYGDYFYEQRYWYPGLVVTERAMPGYIGPRFYARGRYHGRYTR